MVRSRSFTRLCSRWCHAHFRLYTPKALCKPLQAQLITLGTLKCTYVMCVLSFVRPHVGALTCVLFCVCFCACALIGVLSCVCSYMRAFICAVCSFMYVLSFGALSNVCSHVCALMFVLSYVCSHVFAHICVLSCACFHSCVCFHVALMCVLYSAEVRLYTWGLARIVTFEDVGAESALRRIAPEEQHGPCVHRTS